MYLWNLDAPWDTHMYNVCMCASYTAAQASFSSTCIYNIRMYVYKQCSYTYMYIKKFFGVKSTDDEWLLPCNLCSSWMIKSNVHNAKHFIQFKQRNHQFYLVEGKYVASSPVQIYQLCIISLNHALTYHRTQFFG